MRLDDDIEIKIKVLGATHMSFIQAKVAKYFKYLNLPNYGLKKAPKIKKYDPFYRIPNGFKSKEGNTENCFAGKCKFLVSDGGAFVS